MPYHIGVAQVLQDAGVITATTRLAGASGGAVVAAALACGLAPRELLTGEGGLLNACAQFRDHGVRSGMAAALERQLNALLPPDAHARCSGGRLQVAVSHLLPLPHRQLHGDFPTREDLIAALMASCHVPGVTSSAPAARFRGAACIDGGALNLLPVPTPAAAPATAADADASTAYCVQVLCFPAALLPCVPGFMRPPQRVDIAPHSLCVPPAHGGGGGHTDVATAVRAAARAPMADDRLWGLYMQGTEDCASWIAACGFIRAIKSAKLANRMLSAMCCDGDGSEGGEGEALEAAALSGGGGASCADDSSSSTSGSSIASATDRTPPGDSRGASTGSSSGSSSTRAPRAHSWSSGCECPEALQARLQRTLRRMGMDGAWGQQRDAVERPGTAVLQAEGRAASCVLSATAGCGEGERGQLVSC